MSDLLAKIRAAQIEAGERVVIENLRKLEKKLKPADSAPLPSEPHDAGLALGYLPFEDISLVQARANLRNYIEALRAHALALAARVAEAEQIIRRYVKETPLGHQPHMIAHVAEAWLAARVAELEGKK